MLPTKLILKNFLSYGNEPQEINFEGHSIIYLSGNNGNGKSALLESITWVIWGFARKSQGTTKSDDNVMRINSTDMFVSLEFISGNKKYLIKRTCEKKNKRINTELALFLLNDFNNESMSILTCSSQKETQELINNIIGIDYDVFINTMFLRQGNANEFSKKTPKERKDILCNVLGINKIENVRQKVISDLKEENLKLNFLKNNLESLNNNITEEILIEKKNNLYERKNIFLNKKNIQNELKNKFKILEDEIKEIFQNILKNSEKENLENLKKIELYNNYQKKKIVYLKIKDLIFEINNLKKNNLKFLNKNNEDINLNYLNLKNDISNLNNELLNLNSEYNNEKNNFINENKFFIENKKNEIKKFKEEIQKINSELKLNNENLKLNKDNFENYSKNKILYEKYINQKIFYENKINKTLNIIQKINFILSKINNNIENNNIFLKVDLKIENKKCYFCESILSEEKILKINENLKIKLNYLNNYLNILNIRKNRFINYEKNYKKEYNDLLLKINHCEKVINENINSEILFNNLQILINDKNEIILKNNDLLKLTENNLINSFKEYDLKLFNIENKYKERINLLNEKKNILNNQDLEFSKINNFIFMLNKLNSDLLNQPSINIIRKEILEIILNIKIKKKNVINLKSDTLKYIKEKNEKENKFLVDKKIIEENDIFISKMHEEILEDYAKYNFLENQFNEFKEKKNKLKEEYDFLSKEYNLKNNFAFILSKDEIQAMLIEQSIPLIENEANKILHMLTEKKYTIYIESIKDLKSGKSKETLDIIIADSLGIRQYEFFSGGEAFRIDLSIRIALAKVLAQRSGKNIKTFIVDEGFGSQDGVSLESVIQTIHTLQSEFDLIIIVSHLTELKEQFDTHFIVQKNLNGSYINIINN